MITLESHSLASGMSEIIALVSDDPNRNEVKSEMGTETRTAAHQCRVAKAKGEYEINSRGDCIL